MISQERAVHILWGDQTGGGHLWPGRPGKSPFPQNWSAQRILDAINFIASNPYILGLVPINFNPTSYRIVKEAAIDGVPIRVVIQVDFGFGWVVTGFPIRITTNQPMNP